MEPADNVIPSQGLRLWFYDSAPLPHYWARRTRLGDGEIRIWGSMSPLMDGYCKEVRGWRADMENFYRLSKQWMAATNKEWDSSPHLNTHTHTYGLYFLPPSVQASGLPGRANLFHQNLAINENGPTYYSVMCRTVVRYKRQLLFLNLSQIQ